MAADAPIPGAGFCGADQPEETGRISAQNAIDFLALATTLGFEEMNDTRLESMVCTPHALPRKLFFQALCPCAEDPDTKVSDLEILALMEESERSGADDEETALSLKDVDRDVTSADFFMFGDAVEVETSPQINYQQQVVAAGGIPENFVNRVLRSGTASF